MVEIVLMFQDLFFQDLVFDHFPDHAVDHVAPIAYRLSYRGALVRQLLECVKRVADLLHVFKAEGQGIAFFL